MASTYIKKAVVSLVLVMVLGTLVSYWYFNIIPKENHPVLSEKIKKIMSGELSSKEIYKDEALLKEMIACLDSKAVMGTRIKVAVRRSYPMRLKKKGRNRYFTRSDWALEVLSYVSTREMAIRPSASWIVKESRLQFSSGLSPKLLFEDQCLEVNKELIEKWKILWKEYFDYVSSKGKTI